MSLPYRQRHRLRGMSQALRLSEPRLASLLTMFSRLNAGEAMPAREQVRRRLPEPVRALARAVWAVLRMCARALAAWGRRLRLLDRPLRSCGRFLAHIALCCLVRCSFLPAGFRLTVGSRLAAARPSAPLPPNAHRRNAHRRNQ